MLTMMNPAFAALNNALTEKGLSLSDLGRGVRTGDGDSGGMAATGDTTKLRYGARRS
jgi:hypothetical protein